MLFEFHNFFGNFWLYFFLNDIVFYYYLLNFSICEEFPLIRQWADNGSRWPQPVSFQELLELCISIWTVRITPCLPVATDFLVVKVGNEFSFIFSVEEINHIDTWVTCVMQHFVLVTIHHEQKDFLVAEHRQLDGFLDEPFDSLKICNVAAGVAFEQSNLLVFLLAHVIMFLIFKLIFIIVNFYKR